MYFHLDNLMSQFLLLGGVAMLVAVVVNVLKALGLPDGAGNKASAGLSLIAFAGFVYLKMFQPEVDIFAMDKQFEELAEIITYVLGLVVSLGLPSYFHKFLADAGVPLLGFSYKHKSKNIWQLLKK